MRDLLEILKENIEKSKEHFSPEWAVIDPKDFPDLNIKIEE